MLELKILGTGCAKCKRLETLVSDVCKKNAIETTIEKVEDIGKIIDYGVISTPGLVVNGVVRAAGRIPSEKEIAGWLKE